MVAEQIHDAGVLHVRGDRGGPDLDLSYPQAAQLLLRALQPEAHLFYAYPGLLEGAYGATDEWFDALFHGEDVEVRAVGDLEAADGTADRGEVVGAVVGEAEGISRVR